MPKYRVLARVEGQRQKNRQYYATYNAKSPLQAIAKAKADDKKITKRRISVAKIYSWKAIKKS